MPYMSIKLKLMTSTGPFYATLISRIMTWATSLYLQIPTNLIHLNLFSADKLPSGGDHDEKAPVDGSSEKETPKAETKITGKNTLFAPRAVIKPLGWNKKDEKPDVVGEELKSNDDFRNLLLKK